MRAKCLQRTTGGHW